MKTHVHILFLIVMLFISSLGKAAVHTVQVSNFSFQPANLTGVAVGDVIHFIWVSGVHTTTSATIPATAAPWDAPITSSQTTFDYPVTVPGVYDYVCTPHAGMGMVGSFTVASGVTLSVTPNNQNVASSVGSTNFSVVTTGVWTASSNATWCTVTPSGTGNGVVAANYGENSSVQSRVAVITVTVSGLPSKTVTVTQAGAAPVLSVGPSSQSVSALAGSFDYTVQSNTDWSAVSDASWCVPTASGSGNGTLTADYEENPTTVTRIATITVTVTGLAPQVITLLQDGSGVGIAGRNSKNLFAFPNPSSGLVKIQGGEMTGTESELSVIDISGNIVYTARNLNSSEIRVDLTAQPRGIYLIRLVKGSEVEILRLVLN